MVSPDPKKRMKYAVSLYLLLMEKGKLSPGAGSPSPPLLATEVLNPLAALSDVEARRESIVLKINNEHFGNFLNVSGL